MRATTIFLETKQLFRSRSCCEIYERRMPTGSGPDCASMWPLMGPSDLAERRRMRLSMTDNITTTGSMTLSIGLTTGLGVFRRATRRPRRVLCSRSCAQDVASPRLVLLICRHDMLLITSLLQILRCSPLSRVFLSSLVMRGCPSGSPSRRLVLQRCHLDATNERCGTVTDTDLHSENTTALRVAMALVGSLGGMLTPCSWSWCVLTHPPPATAAQCRTRGQNKN